ncbi:hypothetical protein KSP40_PGU017557 [Platanthera guangdongensis]|uniref:Uncharacterized protein n=1 Tax=Platanthera guangdongensis TaxID=2320717 RepID=A0ABR2M2Y1_9ASPA
MIAVPTIKRSASLSSPAVCLTKKLTPAGGRRLHSSLSTTTDAVTHDPPEKSAYQDSRFGRLAIRHLSTSIEAITGSGKIKEGYEGLIEAASIIARRKGGKEQQEIVAAALDKAFPAAAMAMASPPSSSSSSSLFGEAAFLHGKGQHQRKVEGGSGKEDRNVGEEKSTPTRSLAGGWSSLSLKPETYGRNRGVEGTGAGWGDKRVL